MQPLPVQRSSTPIDPAGIDPRLEAARDQLGQRRARNQHPLIDEEWQAGKPGLAGQVGIRQSIDDAAPEQLDHLLTLARQQPGIQHPVIDLQRQMQRVQNKPQRLIPQIIAAMAQGHLRCPQTADPPTQKVAQGQQLGLGGLEVGLERCRRCHCDHSASHLQFARLFVGAAAGPLVVGLAVAGALHLIDDEDVAGLLVASQPVCHMVDQRLLVGLLPGTQ
jgi:hypothetical protein